MGKELGPVAADLPYAARGRRAGSAAAAEQVMLAQLVAQLVVAQAEPARGRALVVAAGGERVLQQVALEGARPRRGSRAAAAGRGAGRARRPRRATARPKGRGERVELTSSAIGRRGEAAR